MKMSNLEKFVQIAVLAGMAILAVMVIYQGTAKTFDPQSQGPVRYTWLKTNGTRACEVRYPNQAKASCSSFEQEALNEFHLEYANPYKNRM